MTILNRKTFEAPELRLFVALVAVLGVFLFISLLASARHKKEEQPKSALVSVPFNDVTLTAKAAYVYDMRTHTILYAKNESARLPLASLTKVMTALVASEQASATTTITITRESLSPEGDSGLLVGERFRLKDLLDFSLTMSSNDGMLAIALGLTGSESSFADAMNRRAAELGMKNTHYANVTGLDESTTRGGAYGSAEDMALLFEYILSKNPRLLEATQNSTVSVHSDVRSHIAYNTDILADIVPGLRASKTGFTDLAGGNLVIVFDPEVGRPIIVSVLGSTESGRFKDVQTLVNRSLKAISTGDPNRGK